MKYISISSSQTKKIGEKLARKILKAAKRTCPPKFQRNLGGLAPKGDTSSPPASRLEAPADWRAGFRGEVVHKKKAQILALEGDLGGGKTTFLQGFAKGLGVEEKILSPTFVIMRKFRIKNKKSEFKNFYHFDCYRIKKAEEVLTLGFREIVSDSKNIVAIEWADRIKKILPKNRISLRFEFLNKKTRKITLKKNDQ